MAISAIRGAIQLGIQSAKNSIATVFTSYAATNLNIGPIVAQQELPKEIGGVAFPRGAYRLGYNVAGVIEGVARLEDIGKLLYAGFGAVTTGPGPEALTYEHVFAPAADQFSLPWVTIQRTIGGEASADVYMDCKVISCMFTITNRGYAAFQIAFLGIQANYSNITIPKPATIAFSVGCVSAVSLVSASPVVNLSIGFVQAMIGIVAQVPQMEELQDIGSYVLADIPILGRDGNCRLTHRWADRVLYNAMTGLGANPAAWNPSVFTADVTVTMDTTFPIGATATNHSLVFEMPDVSAQTGPVQSQGNRLLYMGVDGSMIGDDVTATLINGVATIP